MKAELGRKVLDGVPMSRSSHAPRDHAEARDRFARAVLHAHRFLQPPYTDPERCLNEIIAAGEEFGAWLIERHARPAPRRSYRRNRGDARV